jgi:transposase
MLETETGELMEMTLTHEGNNVREFYSRLPRPVRVGIEATGSMQWFVNLMEELGIECLVGPSGRDSGSRATETET